MENIKIKVEAFKGNCYNSASYIEMATSGVDSHLDVYLANDFICIPQHQAKEMVRQLAVAYGFIHDETTITRDVIVDSNGDFIRFAV